jgi:hypothetical protein
MDADQPRHQVRFVLTVIFFRETATADGASRETRRQLQFRGAKRRSWDHLAWRFARHRLTCPTYS